MIVLKFGGTSVGSPERMHALVKLIGGDKRRIVVLSAVAGTTNALVEISNAYHKRDAKKALELIATLKEQYIAFVKKLYSTEKGRTSGNAVVEKHFSLLAGFGKAEFSLSDEKAILAQGELMSTTLFHYYLGEAGVKSVLLPALEFMRIDENGEPVLDYIAQHLSKELAKYPSDQLFITQGYICRNPFGEIDNLKRGGSDYTATLLGGAIRADEIQIWTDIDGMHNNDPRYVSGTRPIAELSFEEAAELAYFGAKILHPTCVWPAQKYGIPVRLLNTMQPGAKGTVITAKSKSEGDIRAVAAKDGIIAVNIRSSRMLLAYGFLRSVFEVFERYKTPIDMITTSEVAVSLTIDNPAHLDDILKELKQFGEASAEKEMTIICIVGDMLADKKGYAMRIFESLKSVPVRMISYGGSENNISVLVKSEYKKEALVALNEGLFSRQKEMTNA